MENQYNVVILESATGLHLLFQTKDGRFRAIADQLYDECYSELDDYQLEQAKKASNNYCWPCHEKRDIASILRQKGYDLYMPDYPSLQIGKPTT